MSKPSCCPRCDMGLQSLYCEMPEMSRYEFKKDDVTGDFVYKRVDSIGMIKPESYRIRYECPICGAVICSGESNAMRWLK